MPSTQHPFQTGFRVLRRKLVLDEVVALGGAGHAGVKLEIHGKKIAIAMMILMIGKE